MAFTRNTVIDASPSGDSVKQAVLDLDCDLTAAFDGLNQIQSGLALKIDQSAYDQPSGVPRLDDEGLIATSQLPSTAPDLPVGLVAAFAAESLPTDCNWLECDGSELLIADYEALYDVIGNTFGLGNPGYFVLPDLRGRFLRGWDHSRGLDPGAALRSGGDHVGSTQDDSLKKHNHPMGNGGGADGGAAKLDYQAWNKSGSPYNVYTQDMIVTGDSLIPSMFANVPQGVETRPANIALLYCIKWR